MFVVCLVVFDVCGVFSSVWMFVVCLVVFDVCGVFSSV